MMDTRVVAGALIATTLTVSAPAVSHPLPDTLPDSQKTLLFCGVDSAMVAADCGPQPGRPSSSLNKQMKTLIQAESVAPDYLSGATPGSHVILIARRLAASSLDPANPGRAMPPQGLPSQFKPDADWSLMPNAGDINGYFPERELRMGVSGSATARCTVGPQGDLLGCWTTDDQSTPFGFAAATLYLTTFVQLKQTAKDGSFTAGHEYNLRVAFDGRNGKITLLSGQ
jgi:hypothetical protein